jgi:hypothetical protein
VQHKVAIWEDQSFLLRSREVADNNLKLMKHSLPFLTGTPSSSGMDVQRYISELQDLRTILLTAQAEQEAQSAKMSEVRKKNGNCSLYFFWQIY